MFIIEFFVKVKVKGVLVIYFDKVFFLEVVKLFYESFNGILIGEFI